MVKAFLRTVTCWTCPDCGHEMTVTLPETTCLTCDDCCHQFDVEPPLDADTEVSPEVLVIPDTPEMRELMKNLHRVAKVEFVETPPAPLPVKK